MAEYDYEYRKETVRFALEQARNAFDRNLHWDQIAIWLDQARQDAAGFADLQDEVEQADTQLRDDYRQNIDRLLAEIRNPSVENRGDLYRALKDQTLGSPFEEEYAPVLRELSQELQAEETARSYAEVDEKVEALWREGDQALNEGRGDPEQIIEDYFWEAVRIALGATHQQGVSDERFVTLVQRAREEYYSRRQEFNRVQTYSALREEGTYLKELRRQEPSAPNKRVPVVYPDGTRKNHPVPQAITEVIKIIVDRAQQSAERYLKTAEDFLQDHNPKAADEAYQEVQRRGEDLRHIDQECRWETIFQQRIDRVGVEIDQALRVYAQAEEYVKQALNNKAPLDQAWKSLQEAYATYPWVLALEDARKHLRDRAQREFRAACEGVKLAANRMRFDEARKQLDKLGDHPLFQLMDHDLYRADTALDAAASRAALQEAGEYVAAIEQEQEDLKRLLPEIKRLYDAGEFRTAKTLIDSFIGDHPRGVLDRSRKLNEYDILISTHLDARQIKNALERAWGSDDPDQIERALESAESFIANNIEQAERDGVVQYRDWLEHRLRYHQARKAWLQEGNADDALARLEIITSAEDGRVRQEDVRRAEHLHATILEVMGILKGLDSILPEAERKLQQSTERDLFDALDLLSPYRDVRLPLVGTGKKYAALWEKLQSELIPKLTQRARNMLRPSALMQLIEDWETIAQLRQQLELLNFSDKGLIHKLTVREHVLRAREAETRGDWLAAYEAWKKANELAISPENYQAQLHRADLYKRLGDLCAQAETPAQFVRSWDEIDRDYRMRQMQDPKLDQWIREGKDHARQVHKHLHLIVTARSQADEQVLEHFLDNKQMSLDTFWDVVCYMRNLGSTPYVALFQWWWSRSQQLRARLGALSDDSYGNYWELLDHRTRLLLLDPDNEQVKDYLRQLPERAKNLRQETSDLIDGDGWVDFRDPGASVEQEMNKVRQFQQDIKTVQSVARVLKLAGLAGQLLPAETSLVFDDEIEALETKHRELEDEVNPRFKELYSQLLTEASSDFNWTEFDSGLKQLENVPHRCLNQSRPASYASHATVTYLKDQREIKAQNQTKEFKEWLSGLIETWALDQFLRNVHLPKAGIPSLEDYQKGVSPISRVAYQVLERSARSSAGDEYSAPSSPRNYKRFVDWPNYKQKCDAYCEAAKFDAAREEAKRAWDRLQENLGYLSHRPDKYKMENLVTIGDAAYKLGLLCDDLEQLLRGYEDEIRAFLGDHPSEPKATITGWKKAFYEAVEDFESTLQRYDQNKASDGELREAWRALNDLVPEWPGLASYEEYASPNSTGIAADLP